MRLSRVIEHVLNDLKAAGLVINIDKPVLVPTTKIECLGFIIDSTKHEISVSGEKVDAALDMVSKLLGNTQSKHSVRFMAQIAGKLQSMKPAMGPIIMVHLRRMYILMNEAWS